jgi:hypothetical protein
MGVAQWEAVPPPHAPRRLAHMHRLRAGAANFRRAWTSGAADSMHAAAAAKTALRRPLRCACNATTAALPGLAGKKRTRSTLQVKRHEEVVWSQPARAADQVAADRAHALGRAHCDGALTAQRLTARRAETLKSWLRRIRGAGAPAGRLSPSHGARSFEFQRVGLWALPLRATVRQSASDTESSLVVNGRPSVRLYTEFCSDPV